MTLPAPQQRHRDQRDAVAVACAVASLALYPVAFVAGGADCAAWRGDLFAVAAVGQFAVGMICMIFGRLWVSAIPFTLLCLGILLALLGGVCEMLNEIAGFSHG